MAGYCIGEKKKKGKKFGALVTRGLYERQKGKLKAVCYDDAAASLRARARKTVAWALLFCSLCSKASVGAFLKLATQP